MYSVSDFVSMVFLRVKTPCRELIFADTGNLDHCAKYLNQTLVTFGFSASLDIFATDPVGSTPLGLRFFIQCGRSEKNVSLIKVFGLNLGFHRSHL